MKRVWKALPFFLALSIFLSVFEIGFAASVYIGSSSSTPIIDGVMDEVWYSAETVSVTKPIYGTVSPDADFRMMWRENCLYFYIRVFDKDISYEGNPEDKDGITLWINPTNHGESFDLTEGQLRITVTAPADEPPIIECASSVMSEVSGAVRKAYVKTDFGYIVELSVDLSPLSSANVAASGTTMGIDLWVTNQSSSSLEKESVISAFGYRGNNDESLTDTVIFTTVSHSEDRTEVEEPSGSESESDDPPETEDGNSLWTVLSLLCATVIVVSLGITLSQNKKSRC